MLKRASSSLLFPPPSWNKNAQTLSRVIFNEIHKTTERATSLRVFASSPKLNFCSQLRLSLLSKVAAALHARRLSMAIEEGGLFSSRGHDGVLNDSRMPAIWLHLKLSMRRDRTP